MKSNLLIFIVALFLLTSCELFRDPHKRKTAIDLTAARRQYFPLLQGDKIKMQLKVKNTGKELLLIEEVLSPCPCITIQYPKVIPVGQYDYIQLVYDSSTDLGAVSYRTSILTNTKQQTHFYYFKTQVISQQYKADYKFLFSPKAPAVNHDSNEHCQSKDNTPFVPI